MYTNTGRILPYYPANDNRPNKDIFHLASFSHYCFSCYHSIKHKSLSEPDFLDYDSGSEEHLNLSLCEFHTNMGMPKAHTPYDAIALEEPIQNHNTKQQSTCTNNILADSQIQNVVSVNDITNQYENAQDKPAHPIKIEPDVQDEQKVVFGSTLVFESKNSRAPKYQTKGQSTFFNKQNKNKNKNNVRSNMQYNLAIKKNEYLPSLIDVKTFTNNKQAVNMFSGVQQTPSVSTAHIDFATHNTRFYAPPPGFAYIAPSDDIGLKPPILNKRPSLNSDGDNISGEHPNSINSQHSDQFELKQMNNAITELTNEIKAMRKEQTETALGSRLGTNELLAAINRLTLTMDHICRNMTPNNGFKSASYPDSRASSGLSTNISTPTHVNETFNHNINNSQSSLDSVGFDTVDDYQPSSDIAGAGSLAYQQHHNYLRKRSALKTEEPFCSFVYKPKKNSNQTLNKQLKPIDKSADNLCTTLEKQVDINVNLNFPKRRAPINTDLPFIKDETAAIQTLPVDKLTEKQVTGNADTKAEPAIDIVQNDTSLIVTVVQDSVSATANVITNEEVVKAANTTSYVPIENVAVQQPNVVIEEAVVVQQSNAAINFINEEAIVIQQPTVATNPIIATTVVVQQPNVSTNITNKRGLFTRCVDFIKADIFGTKNKFMNLINNTQTHITNMCQYFNKPKESYYLTNTLHLSIYKYMLFIVLAMYIYRFYFAIPVIANRQVMDHLSARLNVNQQVFYIYPIDFYISLFWLLYQSFQCINLAAYLIVQICRLCDPNVSGYTLKFLPRFINRFTYYMYGYRVFYDNTNDYSFSSTSVYDNKRKIALATTFCKTCHTYGHTIDHLVRPVYSESLYIHHMQQQVMFFYKNIDLPNTGSKATTEKLSFFDVYAFSQQPQRFLDTKENAIVFDKPIPSCIAVCSGIDMRAFAKKIVDFCGKQITIYLNDQREIPHYLLFDASEGVDIVLDYICNIFSPQSITYYGVNAQPRKAIAYNAFVDNNFNTKNSALKSCSETVIAYLGEFIDMEDRKCNNISDYNSDTSSLIGKTSYRNYHFNQQSRRNKRSSSSASTDESSCVKTQSASFDFGIRSNAEPTLNFAYIPSRDYIGYYQLKFDNANCITFLLSAIIMLFFSLMTCINSVITTLFRIRQLRIISILVILIYLCSFANANQPERIYVNILNPLATQACDKDAFVHIYKSQSRVFSEYFNQHQNNGAYYSGSLDKLPSEGSSLLDLYNQHPNGLNLQYINNLCYEQTDQAPATRTGCAYMLSNLNIGGIKYGRSYERDAIIDKFLSYQPLNKSNEIKYQRTQQDSITFGNKTLTISYLDDCAKDFCIELDNLIEPQLTFGSYIGDVVIKHNKKTNFLLPYIIVEYNECYLNEGKVIKQQYINITQDVINTKAALINYRSTMLKYGDALNRCQQDFQIPTLAFERSELPDCPVERVGLHELCIVPKQFYNITSYTNHLGLTLECFANDALCNRLGQYYGDAPILAVVSDKIVQQTTNTYETIANTTQTVYESVKNHTVDAFDDFLNYTSFNKSHFVYNSKYMYDSIYFNIYNYYQNINYTYRAIGNWLGFGNEPCYMYQHVDLVEIYDICVNDENFDPKQLGAYILVNNMGTYEVKVVNEQFDSIITQYELKHAVGFFYGTDITKIFNRYLYYAPDTYTYFYEINTGYRCWAMKSDNTPFTESDCKLNVLTGFYLFDVFIKNISYIQLGVIAVYFVLTIMLLDSPYNLKNRAFCNAILLLCIYVDVNTYNVYNIYLSPYNIIFGISLFLINVYALQSIRVFSLAQSPLIIGNILNIGSLLTLLIYIPVQLIIFGVICSVIFLYYRFFSYKPWDLPTLSLSDADYYFCKYMAEISEKNNTVAYNNLRNKIANTILQNIGTTEHRRNRFLAQCYELLSSGKERVLLQQDAHVPIGRVFTIHNGIKPEDYRVTIPANMDINFKPLINQLKPVNAEGATMARPIMNKVIFTISEHFDRCLLITYRGMYTLYGFCVDSHLYVERHIFNKETNPDYGQLSFDVKSNITLNFESVVVNKGFHIFKYDNYKKFSALNNHPNPLEYHGQGFLLRASSNTFEAVNIDHGTHDGNTFSGDCGYPLFAMLHGKLQFLGLHCASFKANFDNNPIWGAIFDSEVNINYFTTLEGEVQGIENYDMVPVYPNVTRPVLNQFITGRELTQLCPPQSSMPYNAELYTYFGITKDVYNKQRFNISLNYIKQQLPNWTRRTYEHGFSLASKLILGSPYRVTSESAEQVNIHNNSNSFYHACTFSNVSYYIGLLYSLYYVIMLGFVSRNVDLVGNSFLSFYVTTFFSLFDIATFCYHVFGKYREMRRCNLESVITFFSWVSIYSFFLFLRFMYFFTVIFPNCGYAIDSFVTYHLNKGPLDIYNKCYDRDFNVFETATYNGGYYLYKGSYVFHITDENAPFSLSMAGLFRFFIYFFYNIHFDYLCYYPIFCQYTSANVISAIYGLINAFVLLNAFLKFLAYVGEHIHNNIDVPQPVNKSKIIKVESNKYTKKDFNRTIHLLKYIVQFPRYYDFIEHLETIEKYIADPDSYGSFDDDYARIASALYYRFKPLIDVFKTIQHLDKNIVQSYIVLGVDGAGSIDVDTISKLSQDVTPYFNKYRKTITSANVEQYVSTAACIQEYKILDDIEHVIQQRDTKLRESVDIPVLREFDMQQLIDTNPDIVKYFYDDTDTVKNYYDVLLSYMSVNKDDPKFAECVLTQYQEMLSYSALYLQEQGTKLNKADFNRLNSKAQECNAALRKFYNRIIQKQKEEEARELKASRKRDNERREAEKRLAREENQARNFTRVLYDYMLTVMKHAESAQTQESIINTVLSHYLPDDLNAIPTTPESNDYEHDYSPNTNDGFSAIPAYCGKILYCPGTHKQAHGYFACMNALDKLYYDHINDCKHCFSRYRDGCHPLCGGKYKPEDRKGAGFTSYIRRYFSCPKCILCADCKHNGYERSSGCISPYHHIRDKVSINIEMFVTPVNDVTNLTINNSVVFDNEVFQGVMQANNPILIRTSNLKAKVPAGFVVNDLLTIQDPAYKYCLPRGIMRAQNIKLLFDFMRANAINNVQDEKQAVVEQPEKLLENKPITKLIHNEQPNAAVVDAEKKENLQKVVTTELDALTEQLEKLEKAKKVKEISKKVAMLEAEAAREAEEAEIVRLSQDLEERKKRQQSITHENSQDPMLNSKRQIETKLQERYHPNYNTDS